MMELIGLAGYAGAGKDEAARALVEVGFVTEKFATGVYDALWELDPMLNDVTSVRDLVPSKRDRVAWEFAKTGPYGSEVRRLLQRIGTEVGRKTIGPDVWVDATRQRIAALPFESRVVLTDVRFTNEARFVKEYGSEVGVHGQVWWISRPGVGPLNDHPSEHGLDDWDFDRVLTNDGTIEDLHRQVKDLVSYKVR